MKLIVKDMDIATGGTPVVILNEGDARLLDMHHMDRVLVRRNGKKMVAVVDIAESSKAVRQGHIGLFEEVLDRLRVKQRDAVQISLAPKPEGLAIIRKKLEGATLSYADYVTVVQDIVNDRLTTIELTAFVLANYTNRMDMREIAALTRAMRDTGDVLDVERRGRVIADLHSIGGVPGNRTTPIVCAILVAAGLIVPKTSSRAITSPAGTADTMEVLCSVSLSKRKLERLLREVGGFITWGGAVNLAPADDKIIQVERPLSIDAEGQMLASIMSKKASVQSTHLLIEIPAGQGAKVETRADAARLRRRFVSLGKLLNIHVTAMVTDGSQPIGNGIGPVLEMRDCLFVLGNNRRGPEDLRKKSLLMAGRILEFCKKARMGKGIAMARRILESGAALDKFKEMLRAQGGGYVDPEKLPVAPYTFEIRAPVDCRVTHIDNLAIAKVARLAGAPRDVVAGIDLLVRRNNRVRAGQTFAVIHARSKVKLDFAKEEFVRESAIRYLPISE